MMPATAVIMVQRKAPALSPTLAAWTPSSMVKLLVRRMKVMIATLVMLWKGRGPVRSAIAQESVGHQARSKRHGVSDDEQPHRQLFRGNRKRRFPPSDLWSALPSSNRLGSRRLLLIVRIPLQLHPKQQQQIHPKNIHKMPVARRSRPACSAAGSICSACE